MLTATNVSIVIIVVLYRLDCYIPLTESYTDYTARDNGSSPMPNYVMGSCGGLLTNYLDMGNASENENAFYRHFTQMFLQGGLLHLIANCVGLFFIGNHT